MSKFYFSPRLALVYVLLCAGLFACAMPPDTGVLRPEVDVHAGAIDNIITVDSDAATIGEVAALPGPAVQSSLRAGSALSNVAQSLDRMAITRSSALQDVNAAQAGLRAHRFDRYPQILPSATLPLTNGASPSFGISIEQLIWDAGRTSARLTDAELKVANASLRAWAERNMVVYEGLSAFVEMLRFQARLDAYKALGDNFAKLTNLLETRAAGGVADRGELLRMNVALQEVQRNVVTDTASLRRAREDMGRLLPQNTAYRPNTNLEAAATQCSRRWPVAEAPIDALARVAYSRSEAAERITKAQRYPKILLGAGSNYTSDGWSDPSIGIRLDASDMLGIGRRDNIAAAAASTRAEKATYRLQRDDTRADLAGLEADHIGYLSEVAAFRGLLEQSKKSFALYEEQLNVGSIPHTEGITLYRDQTEINVRVIDTHADSLRNCLHSSQLRGLLALFGETDAN